MATRKGAWKWLAWGLGGLVGVVFLTPLLIRLFVGWFAVIPQNGMYPGLPAGSWIFRLYHPYTQVSQVARGDIILFDLTENGQRYTYVWRVVALPGETVTLEGDALLVNGKEVVREKLRSEGQSDIYRETCGDATYEVALGRELPPNIPKSVQVTLAADQVFVLGDNRHHAVDSRTLGPISFASIVGRKW